MGGRATFVRAALALLLAGVVASPALAGAAAVHRGEKAAKPAAATVPQGVRIAGIPVGGLSAGAAAAAVEAAFATPLPLLAAGTQIELHPARLATAYVDAAVGHARAALPGTNVHLVISVRGAALRSVLGDLSKRFKRSSRDAAVVFKDGRPFITPARNGLALDKKLLLQRLIRSLVTGARRAVPLEERSVKAAVTARSLGPMILIDRAANHLTLIRPDNKVWRVFAVATGQTIYPTPAGRFSIIVKWVNPWWYPPTKDAWAAGLKPVPPGPGNPLGTRWMGLSSPGIGIHGTDEPGSIGYSASHGCIRMQVADSEWLFTKVKVGTTVFII